MDLEGFYSYYLHDISWGKIISAAGLTFVLLKISQTFLGRYRLNKILLEKHELLKKARTDILECIPHDAGLEKLCDLSTRELGQKLRSREARPTDILRAFQRRTADLLPQNCVAEVIVEASKIAEKMNTLQPTESPLFGIPVSLKESISIRGYDSPNGKVKHAFRKAETDGILVSVLRSAGAIPFISTSMPPSGMSQNSSNAIYGEQSHPLDSNRLTGGSSGGEALILLGGGSPLGFGTDIAGSLRIPAAFCGISSLKPTFHRINQTGFNSQFRIRTLQITCCLGPMSRYVDALVDAMRSVLAPEVFSLDTTLPPLSFNDELFSGVHKRSLVIGYYTEFGGTMVPPPVPAVIRSILETKAMLEKAGHRLVEFKLPNPDLAFVLFFQSIFPDAGRELTNELAYEPLSKNLQFLRLTCYIPPIFKRLVGSLMCALGNKTFGTIIKASAGFASIVEALNFVNSVEQYKKNFAQAMQASEVNILIGPVCAFPAPRKDVMSLFIDSAVVYTGIYNILDYPAGVVPVGRVTRSDEKAARKVEAAANNILDRTLARMQRGTEGLPLTVQVIAPPFREESVLRVMKEIETGFNFWIH